jgi:hypothetical protein
MLPITNRRLDDLSVLVFLGNGSAIVQRPARWAAGPAPFDPTWHIIFMLVDACT